MNRRLKETLKRTLPKSLLVGAWARYSQAKTGGARSAFAAAAPTPAWLTYEDLERLQTAYPLPDLSYHYDEESVDKRGQQRARVLVKMGDKADGPVQRFLDLGSWDGMVCNYLREMGKTAVGVDNRIEGFGADVVAAGNLLAGMDAGRLAFASDTFDFVFSYNSFEHFPSPDAVLREALRVVRPGGLIYLDFGPLWLSARGAHQYQTISVPYLECLFPVPLIEQYAHDTGIDLVDFAHMNRWPLSQYRALWQAHEAQLERLSYFEIYNADYVELIERYPSCFRSKTAQFDDLIVSNIEALFIKRA